MEILKTENKDFLNDILKRLDEINDESREIQIQIDRIKISLSKMNHTPSTIKMGEPAVAKKYLGMLRYISGLSIDTLIDVQTLDDIQNILKGYKATKMEAEFIRDQENFNEFMRCYGRTVTF